MHRTIRTATAARTGRRLAVDWAAVERVRPRRVLTTSATATLAPPGSTSAVTSPVRATVATEATDRTTAARTAAARPTAVAAKVAAVKLPARRVAARAASSISITHPAVADHQATPATPVARAA